MAAETGREWTWEDTLQHPEMLEPRGRQPRGVSRVLADAGEGYL